MRMTQIITALFSVVLLVLAGWMAVAPPEPHLAVQAQFEEAPAPTAPITPEPTIPEPTIPTAPKPPAGPAAFTVSGLGIDPEEPEPFMPVEVNFSVTNTGAEQGTYKALVKIAPKLGEIAGFEAATLTKDVTLAGGASQRVHFEITTGPAGIYLISVGDLSIEMSIQGGREPV